MEQVLLFLIGTVIQIVTLMIVIPIAARLVDFSRPGFVETMWKLTVLVLLNNLVYVAFAPLNGFLAWAGGAAVFWGGMVKWFDVDLFGAIVIVLISWLLSMYLRSWIVMGMAQWGGG